MLIMEIFSIEMSTDLSASLNASLLSASNMLVYKGSTKVRIIAKPFPVSASFSNAANGSNLSSSEEYSSIKMSSIPQGQA